MALHVTTGQEPCAEARPLLRAIDAHHHCVPPVLRAALTARGAIDAAFAAQFSGVLGQFAPALDSIDERLSQMDAAGVACAVLSAPPPAAEVAMPEERAELAKRVNDELLAVAARHPGRFLVALTLPMPRADEAAAECIRLGSESLVVAVSLLTHLDGQPIDRAGCDSLYLACAERGLVVLLHPGMDTIGASFADWQLASALGAPLSTTLAAVRLALSGALDRHPRLDVVVPHLGGLGPYLLQRLEDQASPGAAAHSLAYYWRERFYLDTCSFHAPALDCARASVGAARLLLGSDYPFRGPLQRAITDVGAMEADEQEAILTRNAQRLFRGGRSTRETDHAARLKKEK